MSDRPELTAEQTAINQKMQELAVIAPGSLYGSAVTDE